MEAVATWTASAPANWPVCRLDRNSLGEDGVHQPTELQYVFSVDTLTQGYERARFRAVLSFFDENYTAKVHCGP
jgi:hypothetical protein